MSYCQGQNCPWCPDVGRRSDSPDCLHGPEGRGEEKEQIKIGCDTDFTLCSARPMLKGL